MQWLKKISIHYGFIKIYSKDIDFWKETNNIELLIISLDKALYKERIQAINYLVDLQHLAIIPKLLEIARNDFESVSKVALSGIVILDKECKYQQEVKGVKMFWELKKKYRLRRSSLKLPNKRERMKSLENVRQQLKRPIGGGKWF